MKRNILRIFCFVVLSFALFSIVPKKAKAEELNEVINEQLENIDFTEFEKFLDSLELSSDDLSVFKIVYEICQGKFDSLSYNNIAEYLLKIVFNCISEYIPCFLGIISISIFCSIIQNSKSAFVSNGVGEVINLVCFLSCGLLISSQFVLMFNNAKNTLNYISKLNEIMSPIILTLMIASGGTVSASLYKPIVAIFSNIIINIIVKLLIPIILIIYVFSIISNLSIDFKLNKFVDFFCSAIKWIIGIIVSVFGIFISVQGVTSSLHDGITVKAAKYAISNSIPIIGGFLRDGFDIFVAGSVLIKNAVGIAVLVVLFYIIVSPIINLMVFSLLLKLTSALSETFSDTKTSSICQSVSKTITLLNVLIILTGAMMFINILLMIFSANAFI